MIKHALVAAILVMGSLFGFSDSSAATDAHTSSFHIAAKEVAKWKSPPTSAPPVPSTTIPLSHIPPKRASRAPRVVTAASLVVDATNVDAKMWIYMHESGNDPTRHNASGCRGLGQACPGSKLPCSDTDYACQDAWFTNYMTSRYGTWERAKSYWVAHGWW